MIFGLWLNRQRQIIKRGAEVALGIGMALDGKKLGPLVTEALSEG